MADVKNPTLVIEAAVKQLEQIRDRAIEAVQESVEKAIAAARDAELVGRLIPEMVMRSMTDATMVLTAAFEQSAEHNPHGETRSALHGAVELRWGPYTTTLRERPNHSGAWRLEQENPLPVGKYRVLVIVLPIK